MENCNPCNPSASIFDSQEYQENYVTKINSDNKIVLVTDSIHCASCVHLIESSLNKLEGIITARVNLTEKRITVVWDNKTTSLSVIMKLLDDIGHTANPYKASVEETSIKASNEASLYRIAFAGFAMMNLLWISVAMYGGADSGEYSRFFEQISFFLATPTLFYSGWPFLKNAVKSIVAQHLNMDLPIAIGALTTYIYSVYQFILFPGTGGAFFDTVVNFIFVILIGRYLEARARQRALALSNNLAKIQPKVVLIKSPSGEEIPTPIESVKIGDLIIVRAGDLISLDGVVDTGDCSVDESIITGESEPIYKKIGDKVFGGSITSSGFIEFRVEKLLGDSTLSTIIDMAKNTQPNNSKLVALVDKIIPYFVGSTLALSLLTFIFWFPSSFEMALLASVSVLIITCPCALGLATPMAMAVSSGVGASKRILFKNHKSFDHLNKVKTIILDKTGTLTTGKFSVNNVVSNIDENDFIDIIASLEYLSEHPIRNSILNHSTSYNSLPVSNFKTHPGLGISGTIDNSKYLVGNLDFILKSGDYSNYEDLIDTSLLDEGLGRTCIWCASDKDILGFMAISDTIKPDAKSVIEKLKARGYNICIISGDKENVVANVADLTGIYNYYSSKTPKDKLKLITKITEDNVVLMVGDGVNDAPALKKANVSISFSSGSDLAAQNSDIVSLSPDLNVILDTLDLARITNQTIKQNIVFSLIYNVTLVPLAMMGLITPLFAAIAMPISSIIVVTNAALIKLKS
jgi:Cu2+-exporting ATPase